MFIPLIINGEVKGLMGMANKPGGFTEEDINLASAFAEFVSIALQNSQALESLEKSEQKYKNLSNKLEQTVIERTKELKESEARYKNLSNEMEMILDHIPALVFYKDTQNRFLRLNKYVADAYNLSKEELIGKSLFDLYPEEEAQAYWDDDLEVIKSGKSKLNFEELWDTVEGKKWVSTSKIPFINEEGNITGIIGVSNDITERKMTEQKLKESEEKFSKAFHASPTLMAITRMEDGYFLDVNNTYIQVLGYSREELIGHTSLELGLWVNQEQRSEFKNRLKEDKRIDAFDVDVYTKSGKILTMLFSGDIIYLNSEPHLITIASDITERRITEKKLGESELRYRSLFENMTAAFAYHKIIVDEDDKPIDYEFLEANSAFLEMTSLKLEDIIGKPVTEILPGIENDPVDWIGKYGEVALARTPIAFENYVEPLDQWYNVSAYSPQKYYFATAFTNITERRNIEKKIKDSEKKLRTIFEAIPDIFFLLTEDTTVLDYKAKKSDDLYLPPEEFLSTKLIDKLPYDLGQLTLEKARATIETKKPQTLEYNLLIRNEIHFYEARFLYLSKNQIVALIRDITERKKAEEDLLIKNYALYYSINAITIANLEGYLTYINPSFLKMWGYSDEKEVLGKKTTSFWASEEKAYEVLSQLRNNRSWSGELIGKRNDGRLFDVLLSASLVMDEKDKPICMMATFIDISERKRAEQLIIEENRKLRELSEMKRDIITRVSHELKTPLTSIHGASYYLLNYHKDKMKEEVLEYLEIIHRGGLRLKSLVEDLIDISRLESGKIELKKNVEDIAEIIKDCLKDMDIFANYRKISMKRDLQNEMLIAVDKIRIGQVISNILSNAIKNTPPYGEISITLNDSEDEVSIQVKDTGVGITEEERQSLFKKFGKIERYGKGMDVDTEGSGLGLFISKEIVELHNGSIFFESNGRNKGTTFTIILPKSK